MTVVSSYPVTAAQRAMLVQCLLRPEDGSSNLAFAYHLDGPVDTARLGAVLLEIVASSPALRTTFAAEDGRWEARVTDRPGRVATRTLDDLSSVQDEHYAVARRLAARADQPIAPDAAAQYEFEVTTGRFGTYLTILCSHLIGDAYTFYTFARAVSALYRDGLASPGSGSDQPVTTGPAGIREHPGSLPAATDVPRLETLAQWLGGIETFGHEGLPVPRRGGRLAGVVQRGVMPDALAERFRSSELVARCGSTAVLLAAHAVLVASSAGADDVVVGVPLANRRGVRAKGAMGFFVNTLPLPVSTGGPITWEDLCVEVASRVRSLVRVQDVDLAAHLHEIAPHLRRDQNGFDNAFTVYRQALALEIEDVVVTSVQVPRGVVTYPLATTVADTGTGYVVEISVCEELLPSNPLDRYLHLLTALLEDPQASVTATSTVGPELAATIDALVNSPRTYPHPVRLDAQLADVAARTPRAVALVHHGQETTYEELDRRVDLWASHLQRLTASPRVVVALPRGTEQVVALLAVLRAGRTYVPVDPTAPPARLAHILAVLDEAGGRPPVLVADAERVNPVLADAPLILTAALDTPPGYAVDARAVTPDRHDVDTPAYVIFTSGSTGEPKGVVVTHRNVGRLLSGAWDHIDVTSDDRWCLFHSVAFDFSVWEIFGSLLTGGSLVVLTDDEIRDPVAFAAVLATTGVTILNQTPSAFRRLGNALDPETAARLVVRWTIFGGEALYPKDLEPWLDAVGHQCRALNMYGITETTVHTTAHEIAPRDVVGAVRSTSVIGRPLGDLTLTIVDRHLRRSPLGVPGEILVSGPGLADGYLARPELTAERFLTGTAYGERVYRTGDRAVVQPDGTLVYLGRLDRQVQLRGYRIEPGEIEAALRSFPGVRDCIVRLVEDGEHEPFLGAWVVLSGTRPVVPTRAALRDLLPEYMVPAAITRLQALPVTVNGKVDVAALRVERTVRRPPSIAAGGPDDRVGPLDPVDPVVVEISKIYSDVVGIDETGPDDRFLDTGATSMHLVEIHRRLRDDLGLDLTLVDLFDGGSPRALAARVAPARASVPAPPPARRLPVRRAIPVHRSTAPRTSTPRTTDKEQER